MYLFWKQENDSISKALIYNTDLSDNYYQLHRYHWNIFLLRWLLLWCFSQYDLSRDLSMWLMLMKALCSFIDGKTLSCTKLNRAMLEFIFQFYLNVPSFYRSFQHPISYWGYWIERLGLLESYKQGLYSVFSLGFMKDQQAIGLSFLLCAVLLTLMSDLLRFLLFSGLISLFNGHICISWVKNSSILDSKVEEICSILIFSKNSEIDTFSLDWSFSRTLVLSGQVSSGLVLILVVLLVDTQLSTTLILLICLSNLDFSLTSFQFALDISFTFFFSSITICSKLDILFQQVAFVCYSRIWILLNSFLLGSMYSYSISILRFSFLTEIDSYRQLLRSSLFSLLGSLLVFTTLLSPVLFYFLASLFCDVRGWVFNSIS